MIPKDGDGAVASFAYKRSTSNCNGRSSSIFLLREWVALPSESRVITHSISETSEGLSTNEQPENIALVYLRRIDEKVDGLREDMREVKSRLGILESQYASISNRIDRVEFRLDRIERRLDLVEYEAAPSPNR